MRKIYERVRNHIVTGFIFIMPVLICLVVISRFWKHLLQGWRAPLERAPD